MKVAYRNRKSTVIASIALIAVIGLGIFIYYFWPKPVALQVSSYSTSYLGDGTKNRVIQVPFRPSQVVIVEWGCYSGSIPQTANANCPAGQVTYTGPGYQALFFGSGTLLTSEYCSDVVTNAVFSQSDSFLNGGGLNVGQIYNAFTISHPAFCQYLNNAGLNYTLTAYR